MKDIIKKVLMEAEDDLDWVTEIGKNPIGHKVKINGKRFYIPENHWYHKGDKGIFTKTIDGWNGEYEVVDVVDFMGMECLVVKLDSTYPRVYFNKSDFPEFN